MSTERVHYRGGRIFTADEAAPWAESLIVHDGVIVFAGSDAEADVRAGAARRADLGGAFVMPGVVDAHSHLINLGRSLGQVDLLGAADVTEMQQRMTRAAEADPHSARVLGRSWLLAPLGGRDPHREIIDAVVADRPVYLTSNDLHSAWVNTAALHELGIDDDTPDPEGGTIVRDETGAATGLLLETAALVLMRRAIERFEDDGVRDVAIRRALSSYLAAGVTAVVDMGLTAVELAAIERAWLAGDLTIPVAGHLRIETSMDAEELTQRLRDAIATRDRIERIAAERGEVDPLLRIVGIKVWVDGVIDSGTAAMHEPFADGSRPAPLWTRAMLEPVVAGADAAGMQVAMHAIGDAAVTLALDVVESVQRTRAVTGVAVVHRIEHLEVVDSASIDRLATLGVIVSVQPVHCDPAVQSAWREQLGDERVRRGYPWAELAASTAKLVLGTDAPTAPYAPLPNLYLAMTRRSPSRPELPANHPELALSVEQTLLAATRDAAAASGWTGTRGVLREGYRADFVVLDRDPFTDGPDFLADTAPRLVVLAGTER